MGFGGKPKMPSAPPPPPPPPPAPAPTPAPADQAASAELASKKKRVPQTKGLSLLGDTTGASADAKTLTGE